MNTLCRLFGYSRQSFYNREDPDNDFVDNALETMIVEKAREYRKDNPGLGCAKLYLIVKRLFESTDRMPGRDAFIELLRANGLMVQLKRRRHYKTTDSSHHYHKYDNLIKDVVPMRPNEIWVSDITYIETTEGVCYLSLITDAYSHKIVGWAVGPTLETIYPLEALRMALATIDDETASRLIHHSDRGSQYTSDAFRKELDKYHIVQSLSGVDHCYDNARMESFFATLKKELLYRIPTYRMTREEIKRIVFNYVFTYYNQKRIYTSNPNSLPPAANRRLFEEDIQCAA